MREMSDENVVYNHTEKPIFITTEYEANPLGGPAKSKRTILIDSGEGIDLSILGLLPEKPDSEPKLP